MTWPAMNPEPQTQPAKGNVRGGAGLGVGRLCVGASLITLCSVRVFRP